jgi:hypothetical protein
MQEIKLTQGKIALVDDEDFAYLNQWKWCAVKIRSGGYCAQRKTYKTILMHRVVMKTPDNLVCDHEDHNQLNNQKYNLRNCTYTQNAQNQVRNKYKGVYYAGNVAGYKSSIRVNKELVYLGQFKTKIEAAKAYNNAAVKYFGEFANLNIIEENCNAL